MHKSITIRTCTYDVTIGFRTFLGPGAEPVYLSRPKVPITCIGMDRTCCKNLTALTFRVREEFVTEVSVHTPDETQ